MFSIIMDKFIDSTKAISGYKMNTRQIRIVCYADDAVLIADQEDNLQRLLHKFVIMATKYNMIVSTDETKSIVISKDPICCKLKIQGKDIEQVMNFQYLGMEVSSN